MSKRYKDRTFLFPLAFMVLIAAVLVYALVAFARESGQCRDKGGVYVRDVGGFDYKCIKAEEVE